MTQQPAPTGGYDFGPFPTTPIPPPAPEPEDQPEDEQLTVTATEIVT